MVNKKFKIGSTFEDQNYPWGCSQVNNDTETDGAYGSSSHWITKEDIEHLLNGGILMIEDGEYEHYFKMRKDDNSNLVENMECNHNPEDECKCICHGRILMHDHACCSVCLKCGFRTRCSCKQCKPDNSNLFGEK